MFETLKILDIVKSVENIKLGELCYASIKPKIEEKYISVTIVDLFHQEFPNSFCNIKTNLNQALHQIDHFSQHSTIRN